MIEKYSTPILKKKKLESQRLNKSVSNVKLTPLSKKEFDAVLSDYRKKINVN